MQKRLLILIIFLFLSVAYAHDDFNETKQLIDSGISCDNLNNEQLEQMGDYYMEQMHPGEAHELMHKMMGGEDSITVNQMHINMAKNLYCNENTYGMMGMMNMMGGDMMAGNMMNYGMMGSYGYWSFLNIIYTLLIIGLVILVYLWIIKMWNSMQNKKKR